MLCIKFHKQLNYIRSLADVIFDVYSNPDKTTQRIERGINKDKKHTWQLERKNLISAVNNLIEQ